MVGPTKWKHVSPPKPMVGADESQPGQILLAQVRAVEKGDDEEEFDSKSDRVSQSMRHLIDLYTRQGLLRGDASKAEMILASNGGSIAPNVHQQETLKKKRGRRRDVKNAQKSLGESSGALATDESLVISAVLRILGMQGEKLQSSLLLVALSADLCTAVSEHLHASSSTRIGLAEFEVLSSSGVPLLKALSKTTAQMLSTLCPAFQLESENPVVLVGTTQHADVGSVLALKSCLRAATALVALFGSKLSRSAGLISQLRMIGWGALTFPNNDIQYAASKLTTSLPLSGATHNKKGGPNKSSSDQWSHCLMDSIAALSKILGTIAPINFKIGATAASWNDSVTVDGSLDDMASFFQRNHAMDEERRASACRFLVYGLSNLIVSLLAREGHDASNNLMLMDAQIPLDEILSLLESMLSFTHASESMYYATKKRLRLERIEGGIVSPASLVTEIAGYVKLMGHTVFITLVDALGYPALLPHAKRILRMVSGTMLSSSSSSLRRVVDPSSGGSQLDEKKKKWLHTSIALRTEAIRSFTATISMFGLEPARSKTSSATSWATSQKSSSAEQSITLVGGCLLEQLRWDGKESTDWGTSVERVDLSMVALQSLETILVSCGGFMPLAIRALVDSIAAACLQTVVASEQSPVAENSSIKVAVLQLGSACLASPWPIGSSSSILGQLRRCAQQCRMGNTNTSIAATTALRLCDAMATPRVPALHVDTQRHDLTNEKTPISAASLENDIQRNEEEQKERAMELQKQEEEQDAKRRKVADASESTTQSNSKQSKEAEVAQKMESAAKRRKAQSGKKGEVAKLAAEVPPPVDMIIETANDEGPEQMKEGEDFLPGIVDDDGPDEDDV